MMVSDMITDEHQNNKSNDDLDGHKKSLVYRHIAWMTALRHSMRQRKSWEVFDESRTNREWTEMMHIPEKIISVHQDLQQYLSEDELKQVMSKTNKSTALLYLQSAHLRKLKEKGLLWEFAFLELENLLKTLFDLQGKTERIKNFPYPRQYATLSYFFVWVFLLMLPFGIIPEFENIGQKISTQFPLIGEYFVWLAVPFCASVSWVFHTMERIGRVGENPFEGSANDVPISTISRGIEIDLREMMGEDKSSIPSPLAEKHHVQM